MKKSNYLINEPPLVILPTLAKVIGLNEAIVINQIHYWINDPDVGIEEEGEKWIYNTYEEWQKNFPFWSISTIKRIFAGLEKGGLIISRQFNAKKRDMKKFYRIDYDQLDTIHEVNLTLSMRSKRSHVNNESDTTTDTTTDIIQPEKSPVVEPVNVPCNDDGIEQLTKTKKDKTIPENKNQFVSIYRAVSQYQKINKEQINLITENIRDPILWADTIKHHLGHGGWAGDVIKMVMDYKAGGRKACWKCNPKKKNVRDQDSSLDNIIVENPSW